MLAFGYRLVKESHYQLLKTANTLANAENESIRLKNARLFHQVCEQGVELKKLKHSVAFKRQVRSGGTTNAKHD